MCGQFLIVPKEVVEEIIRDIESHRLPRGDTGYPSTNVSVFPGGEACLITKENNQLKAEFKTWGYEMPWNKGLAFNTRFDTATKPDHNMWKDSLEKRRCLVPCFGFFESHKSETFINPQSGKPNKQKYFFSDALSPLTYLAGIYEDNRFSIMTTDPNPIMSPIHPRMPVVLEPNELDIWLSEDYSSVRDRSSLALAVEKVKS